MPRVLALALAALCLAACTTVIGAATRGNSSGGMSGPDQDFRKSTYTARREVVDDEDALRELAAVEFGCSAAKLDVVALDAVDVPEGWAATVQGCGVLGVYKTFGRSGWRRQSADGGR